MERAKNEQLRVERLQFNKPGSTGNDQCLPEVPVAFGGKRLLHTGQLLPIQRQELILKFGRQFGNQQLQRLLNNVKPVTNAPKTLSDYPARQVTIQRDPDDKQNYTSVEQNYTPAQPEQAYIPNNQSTQQNYTSAAPRTEQNYTPADQSTHRNDATNQHLGAMNTTNKLIAAGRRALPKLASETAKRVEELLTPESIDIMLGFTSLYIASQLTPVGWVSDLIAGGLVLASVLMVGPEVVQVIKHLISFVQIASEAKSENDLEEASNHLATAVTIVGVDVLMAILTHKASESAKPFIKNMLNETAVVEMVTSTGEVVKVPVEEIPENTSRMESKNSSRKSGSTTEKTPGQVLNEYRKGRQVIIESIVGDAPGRLRLEKTLPSNVKLSNKGWQKAHSQGNITGAESAEGIRYAPEEVNQEYQRLGIEQFISDLNIQKAPGVTLYLKTITETHPMGLRLKSITYKIEARQPGQTARTTFFETEIIIANDTYQPKITIEGETYNGDFTDRVEPFLKPLPGRR